MNIRKKKTRHDQVHLYKKNDRATKYALVFIIFFKYIL